VHQLTSIKNVLLKGTCTVFTTNLDKLKQRNYVDTWMGSKGNQEMKISF